MVEPTIKFVCRLPEPKGLIVSPIDNVEVEVTVDLFLFVVSERGVEENLVDFE